MKMMNIFEEGSFSDKAMKKLLVHDSPYFRIINFNFKAGQELPIHSHELEGELSIQILEGEGEYLAEDKTLPAKTGDILICEIAEPHGVKAVTDMRVLVTIAPPL
ncbi:MAG: cupin domain-containing protein [Desulfonatronovibrio sp.]